MALGGLWHGAAWTFVVWGLYRELGLAAEESALGEARGEPDPVEFDAADVRLREIARLHSGAEVDAWREDPARRSRSLRHLAVDACGWVDW